jgi:hypothetical protein
MSFFTNPYLAHAHQQRQRRHYPATAPYSATAYPDHLFATPQYFAPSAVAAQPEYTSLDEEEAAALAHLRAIQRRKETERLARQEAEREALVAHLYQQQRAQAQAEAEARARAVRQREAQLEAQREQVALAKYMRQRQIEAAQAQREEAYRHQQSVLAAREQQQHQLNEQRRRQCARNCAARRLQAPTPEFAQADTKSDVEAFNKWIGSLFGLQLPTETETETETEVEKPAQSAPAPVPTAQSSEPAAAATPAPVPASAPAPAAAEKKAEFPNAINDLLSSYLGLRVEPESKLGEAVSNKVPAGLNELLNQFGLEFFPDQAQSAESAPKEKKEDAIPTAGSSTKPSTSAPTPAPAPAPAPAPTQIPFQSRSNAPVDLADFLSGEHGLPPFIRDILGNVESAFKERSESTPAEEKVEGKGKGVAEGEKRVPASAASTPSAPAPAPTPAPVPVPTVSQPNETAETTTAPSPVVVEAEAKNTSAESLARLDSIASELQLATETFTFPPALSFATSSNTDSAPSLLYNKQNKPYHAQNNKLLQLLLQADGVVSNGDKEVRRKRKQIVKRVEGDIEALERKRDEYWLEVKERRDQTGEVSENESWSSGSTSDHDEVTHVEDVAAQSNREQDDKPSFADVAKSAPADVEPTTAATESKDESHHEETTVASEEVKKDKVEKKDKEEGYELL